MPDDQQSKQSQQPVGAPAARPAQDDDVAGKAYDSRLMRRLLTYLRPYKPQVAVSAVATLLKSASDSAGPLLVMIAVDTYMSGTPTERLSWLARRLARHGISPMRGVTESPSFISAVCSSPSCSNSSRPTSCSGPARRSCSTCAARSSAICRTCRPPFTIAIPSAASSPASPPMSTPSTRCSPPASWPSSKTSSPSASSSPSCCWKSWPLALLTLSVIPAILFVTRIFRAKVRDSYRRQRAATARINSFTQEYVSGMSIVQLFNREQRAFRDFSAVNAENKRAWTDAIFAYAWYYPVVEFLSSTAIAFVLWRGGIAVLNAARFTWITHHRYLIPPSGDVAHWSLFGNVVTIGVLIGFIQYAQRFFRPIQDLSEKYNILQAAMAASERVFKLLDTEPTILSPAHPIPGDQSGSIEFRNVWFTYDQRAATDNEQREPTTSSLPIPISNGSSAASPSPSTPEKPPPSSATPAPAKPPSSP